MTDVSREPTASTLAAFLSGEATPSQSIEVARWAQSNREHAIRLDALRAAWDAIAKRESVGDGAWSADEMWQRLAPRLDEDARPPLRLVRMHADAPVDIVDRAAVVHPPRRVPRFDVPERGRAAGWVVAAACAMLFAAIYADHRATEDVARQRSSAPKPMREYRTGRGQRASGTLPDGSAFQIGPLSALRIPDGYSSPDRVVELEGDGYFNVTHDPQHPFAVRTARTTIHDVGTRFVVRARPAESRVEVAVAEGEVALDAAIAVNGEVSASNDTSRVIVAAGQAAFVDADGAVKRDPHAAVGARFGWTRGELAFDHARVPDALDEMSRWYGDTFVLADSSLRTVRLTTVLRGETLLEALVVLETALDVDAHVSRDTVTLTRHSTGRRSPP